MVVSGRLLRRWWRWWVKLADVRICCHLASASFAYLEKWAIVQGKRFKRPSSTQVQRWSINNVPLVIGEAETVDCFVWGQIFHPIERISQQAHRQPARQPHGILVNVKTQTTGWIQVSIQPPKSHQNHTKSPHQNDIKMTSEQHKNDGELTFRLSP